MRWRWCEKRGGPVRMGLSGWSWGCNESADGRIVRLEGRGMLWIKGVLKGKRSGKAWHILGNFFSCDPSSIAEPWVMHSHLLPWITTVHALPFCSKYSELLWGKVFLFLFFLHLTKCCSFASTKYASFYMMTRMCNEIFMISFIVLQRAYALNKSWQKNKTTSG